jgi:hypothetical protein
LRLTAEKGFNGRIFENWQEGAKVVSQSPMVTVVLKSHRSLHAVCGPESPARAVKHGRTDRQIVRNMRRFIATTPLLQHPSVPPTFT